LACNSLDSAFSDLADADARPDRSESGTYGATCVAYRRAKKNSQ
jgi:hypothetical protein